MRYLRKARLEEGADWFWAMARAHLFANEQIRKRNHYAAVLIESSLVEFSVKFLVILHVHSGDLDLGNEVEVAKLEKSSEEIYDENFAGNIDRAIQEGIVSKRLGSSLHRFRKARNELIHDAFFFGIKVGEAQRFVSSGNRIMNDLGTKVSKLMEEF